MCQSKPCNCWECFKPMTLWEWEDDSDHLCSDCREEREVEEED